MNGLKLGLASMATVVAGPYQTIPGVQGLFVSHLENVLGTSFDLKIVARSYAAARQTEKVVLAEIERLNNILSSYLPTSEFSRWWVSAKQTTPVSEDLWAVLNEFTEWHQQTDGALNAAAEVINQLWQKAAQTQTLPSEAERLNAVLAANQPHWNLDPAHQTAARLSQIPLRLHTFAKSYILDRAAEAALKNVDVDAVVLNSGGDLVIRGNWTETVALTDPKTHAENATPLTWLNVSNRAVATSGNYRRGVWVNNTWYSHIVDPRTGVPAQDIISATVVHPNAVTAGALATAFNVLTPTESIKLAASIPQTDYLIVTKEGQSFTSPDWNDLAMPPASNPSVKTAQILSVSNIKDKLWNANQELLVSFELNRFEGRSHRPFVAVWIEDQNHVPVRQLAIWYNKPRWLPELRTWYTMQRSSGLNAAAIAGATRSAGVYSLVWDGKDDQGQYVKQGKYTINIEAAREHGTYQLTRQEMDFNGKPKQQTLNGNTEIAAAALDYREKGSNR
ncbi:DUF2271 domain-containing protein [Runella aurantiaca]|uniref:FAD:protein FMN transferase n=2 Tax=Runella aurantiaca TaxID=2282308 RepID=A0A369ICT7_9BACT|nr:DUF2271 domain-containing protein [Runella aurantiaca]